MIIETCFRDVNHLNFLYRVYAQRYESDIINIYDTPMNTFGEHVKFLRGRKYKYSYLLTDFNVILGVVFVEEDGEIGIFIDKSERGKRYGPLLITYVMRMHPDNYYYAKVHPKNTASNVMFENLTFRKNIYPNYFRWTYDNNRIT
jgi:RimJ/RimL family protein N-acetyltransferase